MILGNDDLNHYIKNGKLGITGLKEDSIRENGIDCRIGDTIAIDVEKEKEDEEHELVKITIDTHNKESSDNRFVVKKMNEFEIIPPRTNILLVTKEVFSFPDDLMAFCGLRSTVARMGFISPITIVDAGFRGSLTIEAFYGGNNPIKIYRGDRFLHVIFARLNTFVSNPYNGYYTGQSIVNLPKTMN